MANASKHHCVTYLASVGETGEDRNRRKVGKRCGSFARRSPAHITRCQHRGKRNRKENVYRQQTSAGKMSFSPLHRAKRW